MITEILPLNVSVPSRSMLPDKSRFVDFFLVYYTISHIYPEILLLTELPRFDSCSLVWITGAPLLRPKGLALQASREPIPQARFDHRLLERSPDVLAYADAFSGSSPDSIV